MNPATNAPFIHSDRPVKTTLGTILALLAVVAAGVAAWTLVKAEVASQASVLAAHEVRIKSIEDKIAADHDILIEIRADLKALRRSASQQ